MKRYFIDFYDMIDGWIRLNKLYNYEYDNLKEAINKCDQLYKELGEGNKKAGEHYGVIDRTLNKEVYCSKK